MRGKGKYKRKRRKNIIWWVMIALIVTIVFVIGIIKSLDRKKQWETPEEILLKYMNCIQEKRYEDMYSMLSDKVLGDMQHTGKMYCWQEKREQQKLRLPKMMLLEQSLAGLRFLQQIKQQITQY